MADNGRFSGVGMAAQTVNQAHQWSEIAPRLGRALGSDAAVLRAEFDAGHVQGWITDHAAMLTRVEGQELVLVALEGQGLSHLLPHVIQNARLAGLKTMRAHTKRRGLLRLAQRIEPRIQQREIVIEMEL
jgi:hypothetical protein